MRICSSTQEILFILHSNISTEYVSSLVLIDIHSCLMGTDYTPHGYRKSFSLMGEVKRCLPKVLA